VPLEKCFILPAFMGALKDSKIQETIQIETEEEIFKYFSGNSIRRIIIGAPGSGKSTWSRWFQKYRISYSSSHLTFLIKLRDLVKRNPLPSYYTLIQEKLNTHIREEIYPEIISKWCELGLISFILDGFDEIPPSKRDQIFEWINDLSCMVNNAGIIISSRPITTDHLEKMVEPWQRCEILPFDIARITAYIKRWYAYAPFLEDKSRNVDPEKVATDLLSDSTLYHLIGTPLMLATILMVHHIDGELPQGRTNLYARYIDGMLGIWDSRWGIISNVVLNIEKKKIIFKKLAIYLHSKEIDQLGDEEIAEVFTGIIKEMNLEYTNLEILNYLKERTGLLVGPGTWSFIHKNVGEFFVASAIYDGNLYDFKYNRLDRMHLYNERNNDRWTVVLFFWAGLIAPGEFQEALDKIINNNNDDDFVLSLSLLYDQLHNPALLENWKKEIFIKLLKQGFSGKDEEIGFGTTAVPYVEKHLLCKDLF
jgi:hypothetical protein